MFISQFIRPEELLILTDRQREILYTSIASHLVSDPAVRKAIEPRITEAAKSLLKSRELTSGVAAVTRARRKTTKKG